MYTSHTLDYVESHQKAVHDGRNRHEGTIGSGAGVGQIGCGRARARDHSLAFASICLHLHALGVVARARATMAVNTVCFEHDLLYFSR